MTSPTQTVVGKGNSNPLIAEGLLKILRDLIPRVPPKSLADSLQQNGKSTKLLFVMLMNTSDKMFSSKFPLSILFNRTVNLLNFLTDSDQQDGESTKFSNPIVDFSTIMLMITSDSLLSLYPCGLRTFCCHVWVTSEQLPSNTPTVVMSVQPLNNYFQLLPMLSCLCNLCTTSFDHPYVVMYV